MITLSKNPGGAMEFYTNWSTQESSALVISVEPQTQPPLIVETQWTGNTTSFVHTVSNGVCGIEYSVSVQLPDQPAQTQKVYKEAEQ